MDPSKIEVIYHGIEQEPPPPVRAVKKLPERYVLFVGDRSGFKNVYVFARVFCTLSKKYPELRMVLSGGGKLAIAEKEFLRALAITEKVMHVPVSDAELNYLYRHASASVYPSLNEGFGLTILEAFRAGCPAVLSDTPCFREVAGDAAVFFERHSSDDLVFELDRIISVTAERMKLVSKGAERLKLFTPAKMMEKTIRVYESLL